MTTFLLLALAYETEHESEIPRVLYIGTDRDHARSALTQAASEGKLLTGKIARLFRNDFLETRRYERPAAVA